MHETEASIRRSAGSGKRSVVFPATSGLLFATGIPLWFPSLYHLAAEISGPMLQLHIATGVFFGIVFVPAWLKANREKSTFAPLGFSSNMIIGCFWLLVLSGAGLVFSRLLPHVIGKTIIFIHGVASVLLLITIAARLSFMAAAKRSVKGGARSL